MNRGHAEGETHGGLSACRSFGRSLVQQRSGLRAYVAQRLGRRLGGRLDASDVVQDVLVEASRRRSDYLKTRAIPLGPWLRRIARQRLIDLRRRHLDASRRSLDRERGRAGSWMRSGLMASREPSPSAQFARFEERRRVAAAIARLPAEDRIILALRLEEGLRNAEAAGRLSLSADAASKRYGRALRRLAALLETSRDV